MPSTKQARDLVHRFGQECCIPTPNINTSFASAAAAYRSWCHDQGIAPLSDKMFGRYLRVTGLRVEKLSDAYVYVLDTTLSTGAASLSSSGHPEHLDRPDHLTGAPGYVAWGNRPRLVWFHVKELFLYAWRRESLAFKTAEGGTSDEAFRRSSELRHQGYLGPHLYALMSACHAGEQTDVPPSPLLSQADERHLVQVQRDLETIPDPNKREEAAHIAARLRTHRHHKSHTPWSVWLVVGIESLMLFTVFAPALGFNFKHNFLTEVARKPLITLVALGSSFLTAWALYKLIKYALECFLAPFHDMKNAWVKTGMRFGVGLVFGLLFWGLVNNIGEMRYVLGEGARAVTEQLSGQTIQPVAAANPMSKSFFILFTLALPLVLAYSVARIDVHHRRELDSPVDPSAVAMQQMANKVAREKVKLTAVKQFALVLMTSRQQTHAVLLSSRQFGQYVRVLYQKKVEQDIQAFARAKHQVEVERAWHRILSLSPGHLSTPVLLDVPHTNGHLPPGHPFWDTSTAVNHIHQGEHTNA